MSQLKIFNTLLITEVLKYYGDQRECDEFMMRFSKSSRKLRQEIGVRLYMNCTPPTPFISFINKYLWSICKTVLMYKLIDDEEL